MPTGKGRSTWCAGHCCFFLHPICRCREGICTLCPCPCPSAVAERKGQKGLGLLASWWRCVISLDGGWLTGNPGKRGVCRPCCVLGRQGLILERGGGGVVVAGLEEEKRREKSKKKYTHSSARGARMTFWTSSVCRSSLTSWTWASPLSSSWTWSSSSSFAGVIFAGSIGGAHEDGRTSSLLSLWTWSSSSSFLSSSSR